MTTTLIRSTSAADSSMSLKAVRRTAKVKRFLNTLMRSLAAAHA